MNELLEFFYREGSDNNTLRAGATQLDTYYFAIPFFNIHLLCKQLMFGIVRSLFMKEKWMLAK
ncbi:hypothetical protein BACPU_13370 [Bacillus pumilus]|nr:hypothetical protein BACPU_13370 [Bacillus pumilus]